MAAGDVWGNRWLATWGLSWRQAVVVVIPPTTGVAHEGCASVSGVAVYSSTSVSGVMVEGCSSVSGVGGAV